MNVAGVLTGRLRLARHALLGGRGGSAKRARGTAFVVLLVAAMAVLAYLGFRSAFETLLAHGASLTELASALGVALTASLVTLLLFDLDGAVGTLILDPDLALLRRAPLAPASILALKLLDALPRTFGPLLVLALPAWLAFGAATSESAATASLAAPVMLALWLVPLGFGLAIATPLLRLLPVQRAREALGLMATFSLTAAWLANALFLPRLAETGAEPVAAVRAFLAAARALAPLSPGFWAADALAALAAGDASGAGWRLALLSGAALVACLAALLSARGLTAALDTLAARATRRRAPAPAAATPGAPPRSLLGATLGRDVRLFTREWTVLADVMVATVLWTLLPLASGALLQARGVTLARAMLVTLSVGLGYEVAARSIPFERRAAAWIAIAPVSAARWASAKAVSAALLAGTLLLAVSVVLAAGGGLGVVGWVRCLGLALPALGVSILLGLWTGATWGDFRWTNPRRMLTLGGRLVASGLMLFQVLVWLTLAGIWDLGILPARPPLSSVALLVGLLLGTLAWTAAVRRLERGWPR